MNENRIFRRLGLIIALIWLFFCLFPLWWVLVTAFKPPIAVSEGATYLPFIDFWPTLNAFHEAFSGIRGDFVGPILSSVLVSVVVTVLSVFLGSMAAYALVRFEFRIRLLAGLIFAVIAIGGFMLLTMSFGIRAPYALVVVLVLGLGVAVPMNGLNLPGILD